MAQTNYTLIGITIVIFVGIIFALSLLPTIGSYISQSTQAQTIINESYTGLVGENHTLAHGNLTSVTAIINASGTTLQTTNYTTYLTPGIITINAGQPNNTVFNITYNYHMDGYVSDSAGRAVVQLILIFAALAIVLWALAEFWPSWRTWGGK